MPVNIVLADHCKGKHKNDEGCDDSGGDPVVIEYTAKLTGAFAFDTENNPVVVTANKQGNVLKSADSVTLTKPDIFAEPTLAALWDSVFLKCPNFFAPSEVIVPGFLFDEVTDTIVVSAEEKTVDKGELCRRALQRMNCGAVAASVVMLRLKTPWP